MSRALGINSPVLKLNASYEPLTFIPVRDAIRLILRGKAKPVPTVYEEGSRLGQPFPTVVRLLQYHHVPRVRVQPSRKNILLRDHNQCMYCGDKYRPQELTLDHVMPRAQGGQDEWENLVACCKDCNRRKADRTPEQAGMPLLRKPLPASIHTNRHMMRLIGNEQPAWAEYLYIN